MKSLHLIFLFTVIGGIASVVDAQEQIKKAEPPIQTASESPIVFPALAHFAKLWENSIFTTRDLPSPDAPAGPNFADQLSLAGIYEVDGAVVAVLVDRTTSLIMEARIGSENESGIKIRKVAPGASMEKTRIQLQKGDQAGWVSFSEASEAPPTEVAPAILTRPGMPGGGAPHRANPAMQQQSPPQPASPPPSGGLKPSVPDDVPLPPS